MSKSDLAAKFLPASVKQNIEEQKDKDPKRKKQKRLNTLQELVAEAYRRKSYQSEDEQNNEHQLVIKTGSQTQDQAYMMNPYDFITMQNTLEYPVRLSCIDEKPLCDEQDQ